MAQEAEIESALLQSVAVWDPKKASELMETIKQNLATCSGASVAAASSAADKWEAPSLARIAKRNPHVKVPHS